MTGPYCKAECGKRANNGKNATSKLEEPVNRSHEEQLREASYFVV